MSASEQLQQGLQALLQLPCPIALLDQVVHRMHTSAEPARGQADQLLTAFREHADAWTRVDGILETSQSVETKFYALQVRRVVQSRCRAPQRGARLSVLRVDAVLRESGRCCVR